MGWTSRVAAAVKAARSAYAAGRHPAGRPLWMPQRGGAKLATSQATALIADRARDAVRNNAYASRIVELWTANAVGTGITTRWPEGSRQAAAWQRWADGVECDAERRSNWGGVQVLAMRSTVESGEVLLRLRAVRPTPANPVGLELMLLEADLLDSSRHGMNGNNRVTQGIEINDVGAPVAYWLRSEYDGFAVAMAGRSERVPASEIIHLFRRRRPGQVRDVSWLSPVLWQLKDLSQYEAALIRKAEIEACMAAIITDDSESLVTGDATADGSHLVRDGRGQVVENFEPGMILYRRGAGSVDVVNPTGGGTHMGYARRTLEAASVGTGLTYDQVSGDLSQANYSSLRAGKIEFRRLLEQVQYTMLIPQLVERVARRFHEQGALNGLWPAADVVRSHVPPAPEMVDPSRDTSALIAQVRAGFISQQDAVASFGYDHAAMLAEIAAGNAMVDALGLVLDTDPRRTGNGGSAQNAAQNAAIEIAANGAARPQGGNP